MKLLVADDEDYTREGIVESIKWKDYGITEIMQARDGATAMQIAKWFLPDIIITDIKMPRMNGIEFAKRLTQASGRVIFITGYMEIEYLKNAIELQAAAFIEKPIDLQKLKSAVEKITAEIKRQSLSNKISEDMKGLQKQKLANMLIHKSRVKQMVVDYCLEVAFPVKGCYQCLLIWYKSERDGNHEELVRELVSKFYDNWLDNVMENGMHLLILHQSKPQAERFSEVCNEILDNISGAVLAAGFEVHDISQIYTGYKTAELALNNAFFEENERLFFNREIMHRQREIDLGTYASFTKLLAERPEQLHEWVNNFCDELYDMRYIRKEQIQALVVSLTAAVYNEHGDLYLSDDSIEGIYRREDIEVYVNSLISLTEVRQFLLRLSDAVSNRIESRTKHYRLITQVKKYIYNNFSNPELSINDIAAHVSFSPTYLNVLFKQETKCTLKQFLQTYRLELAKRYLLENNKSINEVAESCGYSDPNYFSKVFREFTGVSPGEHRGQFHEKTE